MGNRAVITFKTTPKAQCVYLHWNGGRDSVEAFLRAAKFNGAKGHGPAALRVLAATAQRFIGGSVYMQTYGHADTNNFDNGVYVIDNNMQIVARIFAPREEQVNPARTAEIYAQSACGADALPPFDAARGAA